MNIPLQADAGRNNYPGFSLPSSSKPSAKVSHRSQLSEVQWAGHTGKYSSQSQSYEGTRKEKSRKWIWGVKQMPGTNGKLVWPKWFSIILLRQSSIRTTQEIS
jgi:hypothetical protein